MTRYIYLLLTVTNLQLLLTLVRGATPAPGSTPIPSQTFVRLAGGTTAYQGRVEVFAFNSWGTVCDSGWTTSDATVVCSMLGYTGFSSGGSIQGQATYGQGTGNVWLNSLQCQGSEVSITQCPVGGWGTNSCSHNQDVGVTCPSNQLPDNFLLITDSTNKTIYRMDGRTFSYVQIPLSNTDNPIAVGYDYVDGRILWTDVGLKQIRSATLYGTDDKVIRQLNKVSVPDGIAVDAVSRLIFYTDTGNDVIGLMTIDGFAHLTIIQGGLDEPRAIVADPTTGLVYWSDWGKEAKIERSSYDGSERTSLITTGLVWPNGIAINSDGNELYWCDGGTGKVEKSHLDGSRRLTLSTAPGTHYFGIVYFNDYLYITDWSIHSVFRMNDDGTGILQEGPNNTFGRLNDIHYHRNGWGPSGPNGCSNGRGGCSHICLPNPGNGFYCVCPDGLVLQPDGVTCGTSRPCPALLPPKYGNVSPSNCSTDEAQVGTYCTVTCNPGFTLVGSFTLQCLSDGKWNNMGVPLLCRDTQGPNITCPQGVSVRAAKGQQTATVSWPNPSAVDNTGGSVRLYQSITPPVSLPGGNYTVRVTALDISGLTSFCMFQIAVTVLTCPEFTPPSNGYIDSAVCHSYYGSKCRINCREGYFLSGSNEMTCDTDVYGVARWTFNGASCVAVSCPVPAPPVQGYLKSCQSPYPYQSLCEQSCNSGYQPSTGTLIRRCGQDATWSGEQLVCIQPPVPGLPPQNMTCPSLATPENGIISPGNCIGPVVAPGTVCTLTCNTGYQAMAGTDLTCSVNGQWIPYGSPFLCASIAATATEAAQTQDASSSSTPVVGAVMGVIICVLIIVGGLLLHFHLRRSFHSSGDAFEMQRLPENNHRGVENPVFRPNNESEG